MLIKYNADTYGIKNKLLPIVEGAIQKQSAKTEYKKLINSFISSRYESLYDTIPCDRLLCSELEMDKLFGALNIDKKVVKDIITNDTYYGSVDNFNPLAAKSEFTVVLLLLIRYFFLNKDNTNTDLSIIYLSFSGKFYPSLHYRSYPTVIPSRHIMEYVVNNKLTNKFDLKTKGNVINTIKSIGNTWVSTYKDKFKSLSDEDVVYLIQQLHSRIGSFIKNIAIEYYDAYESGEYLAYDNDSYDSDDYHIADNDALKITKYTESVINFINSTGVDYRICKMCSTSDITPSECKAVIDSIIGNRDNIIEIKELVSLMISLYFATGENDLADIKFITFTISPKPNAKQKEIIRIKEIIENWLSESGTAYIRRRSRLATKNAYERTVRMYFALIIHNVNR